jgi:hypothetical protein
MTKTTPTQITLTVTTATLGTRISIFRDLPRNPARKQAEYWAAIWNAAGHTVVWG